jgi:hypothetical protein
VDEAADDVGGMRPRVRTGTKETVLIRLGTLKQRKYRQARNPG